GHAVMAECHRLRGLQVSEAGHDSSGMLFGAVEECRDQPQEGGFGPLQFLLDPEPEIDRHLVVARTGGVQPAGRRSDQFCKARLDIHVNVLKARGESEFSVLYLPQDRLEPVGDLPLILGRNDALFRQHFGMGQRSADVLGVELAVEADRGVYRFHDGVGARGKSSTPHAVAGFFVAHRDNRRLEKLVKRMSNGKWHLPAFRLIALAAVAGVAAGAIAVYVKGDLSGNNAPVTASVDEAAVAACEAKTDLAKKAGDAATGQVAAMLPADPPQSLKNLAFNGPDGTPITLADLSGKVVLMNLW